MKMKQLRHEKKIYRELERMRKSRTFESSTDRTGQEPDDILNMSAAQRLRMIHAEKMSIPKAERKTPDAKADQLPLPTTLAVDFLPIKKIKNGTIYTDDGRYVKVLEVLPINFLLKSREEQEQVIYDFEKFLRIAPDNFQIKVLAKKTDISSYLQRLNENIACEPDEKCRAMMEDSRKLLIDLGQNEAISRRFFLAFEAPKQELRMQTEEEIERVLCRMRDRTLTYLQNCGNRVAILGSTTEETAKIFFDLLNRTRNSSLDFPKRVSEVYRYYDLNYGEAGTKQILVKEYVTPKRLDFRHSDYLQMDDTYYQTYYVRADSIPARVGAGWTACIINAGDGVDVDLYVEKKDRSRYIERIGRRLRWKGSSIKGMDQSTAEYDELSDRIASGYYLKNGLSGGANTNDFYYFALIVTISAPSLEAMRQKAQAYIDYLKSMEILLSPCDYEQVRAFHSYLPLARCDRKIFSRAKRNILTEGLAACYPFSSYEMSDPDGIILGSNELNGSLCMADFFNTSSYKNANIAIMGTSGAGKTYTIQLLAKRFREKKIQTFIIAPDKGHEYKRLCDNMNGTYVKFSPGGSACINVMEIRKKDDSANHVIDGAGREASELALKIQSLHVFFSLLIPTMTAEEDQILDEALILTYEKYGITYDNASLYDVAAGTYKKMPVLSDLYDVLKEMPEGTKRLCLMLNRFVHGSFASLNQQTNIRESEYMVFDISDIQGEFLTALMYTVLEYVYARAKENRTKKKAIIVDEIWELIGSKSNAKAAEIVLEIFKIIRGYGGAAIAATQDLNDFFSLEDGKYGKGIINNCKTKIVLNLERDEAQAVQKLLSLSAEEYKEILHFERGHGLLCTGGNNIPVWFRSSALEHQLITTDRKDLEQMYVQMGGA